MAPEKSGSFPAKMAKTKMKISVALVGWTCWQFAVAIGKIRSSAVAKHALMRPKPTAQAFYNYKP